MATSRAAPERPTPDPDPAPGPAIRRGPVAAVVVAATVFVVLVCGGWFGAATVPEDTGSRGQTLSALYDPPTRPVEAALNARDGQVFATLAVDPTLRRPELIRGGPGEQAYRHQRPLLGWLGWAASGGQPAVAPWALIVISALSVVALVAAVAVELARRGAPPAVALVLLVLPGVLADLTFVGPEALGTVLVLVGLRAWCRAPRAIVVALVAFAAAGLLRETMLLVPAALAIREVLGGRLRPALVLSTSAVPYVAWVVALRALLGSWPVGNVDGRLSLVPFGGLVAEAGGWPPGEVVVIGLTLALGVGGLVVGREPALRAVLLAQLLLAATLGAPVWARSADVGRVLLPFAVLGLVALLGGRRPAATVRGGSTAASGSAARSGG